MMRKMILAVFALLAVLILLFETSVIAENDAGTPDAGEVLDLGDIRAGGWSISEDATLSETDTERFAKAMEGLVGVDYTPMLCLGNQLGSGMNYCYLCRAQVVYPNAEPYYALVYIYEDLSGNASILDIQTLELGIS